MYFCEFVGYNKEEGYHELCGDGSVFRVDGRLSLETLIDKIPSMEFFKYRHKDAIGFRIIKGERLLTAKKVTDIIVI